MKKKWFEGSQKISCTMQQVKHALENFGEHYLGVIKLMPGLASVELMEQGEDFVTIRTNEGLMHRTNMSLQIKEDRLIVEFDESYQAGQLINAKSHFIDEFTSTGTGIVYHMVISNVEAPGFLGFFYRHFGSANIGKAFLKSTKMFFEKNI